MSPENSLYLELLLMMLMTGCVGGFLSGLLGVGGGTIFVPALFFCLKAAGIQGDYIMHIAVGTSLAVVFATGVMSAYHHYKRHAVDIKIVKSWGPFIILGVIVGSSFASGMDGRTLKEIFSGLLMLISIYMMFSGDKPKTAPKHKIPPYALYIFCMFNGMLSAMIGIGGSIVNIPVMAYMGIGIQQAIGTGSALGLMVALPGTIGYIVSGYPHIADLPPLSFGYINLIALAAIIPTSILLAPLGVKASHSLPKHLLRRIFAVVLALVSLRMFVTL